MEAEHVKTLGVIGKLCMLKVYLGYGDIRIAIPQLHYRRCKMKLCSTCKEWKALSEFNKNKTKTDGYQYACKDCEKIYKKEYYLHTKEKQAETRDSIKVRNKEFLKELKSKLKCSVCGEDRPVTLDFHHINPDEKELSVARAVFAGWSIKRIQKEIDKCTVLCSNCHRILHENE